MIEHRPHVCVVAASPGAGLNCRILREVFRWLSAAREDHARAIPEEVDTIKVQLADTVHALAANCAGAGEFHEHSNEVRHAVALGRYLRNPPAVMAALVSGGEARALTLSSLQEGLSDRTNSPSSARPH